MENNKQTNKKRSLIFQMKNREQTIKNRSLKLQLWVYFSFFAAVIMIILWILEIFMLQGFNRQMKVLQLEKLSGEIISNYNSGNAGNFEDLINNTSYSRGLSIVLYTENAEPVLGGFMFGGNPPAKTRKESLLNIIHETQNDPDFRYSTVIENGRFNTDIVLSCAQITVNSGEKFYLCIDSPLAPVDATTDLLKTQLIIVSAISLLFAFILSYWLAARFTAPIRRISKSAAELAKGNYDVVFEDGTYLEINRLSSTLNRTAKELGKTDKIRRDLMANVSHDLRTPLTIIKSYAEMIRDISGNNPEKRNAHAQTIINESDRLTLLVNDILDLSRIESGTAVLNMKPFNLTNTVQTIINRFIILEESDGYNFEFCCCEPYYIVGDEARIEQVVYNLISNAVNYTGEDKHIAVNIVSADGKVRFSVKDSGKGIPETEQSSVWQRYYKNSETHTRTIRGIGIGLSIVKGILVAHGADFGIISKVGCGSEFWFAMKKESHINERTALTNNETSQEKTP